MLKDACDTQYSKDDMPEVHIIHHALHHEGKYVFDRKEIDECNCPHHVMCRGRV